MSKVLGVALVVVCLLAWSAVGRVTTSEERTAPAGAVGLQLARGGGSSGGSGGGSGGHARAAYTARQKIAEKNEIKKERAAVNEAGDGVFGDDKDDAGDAAGNDEAEGTLRPSHKGH